MGRVAALACVLVMGCGSGSGTSSGPGGSGGSGGGAGGTGGGAGSSHALCAPGSFGILGDILQQGMTQAAFPLVDPVLTTSTFETKLDEAPGISSGGTLSSSWTGVSGENAQSLSGTMTFSGPPHGTAGVSWCIDPSSRIELDQSRGLLDLKVRATGTCPPQDLGHGLPPIVEMSACFEL